MAFKISDATYYRAMETLGYSYIGDSPVLPTFTTLVEAQETEANIVTLLDDIDQTWTQVKEMLPDSLAVKLGTLEVNYAQQYKLLMLHGRRQTQRLSLMLHLPIRAAYFESSPTSVFR